MRTTPVFVQGGNSVDTFIGQFNRNEITQQLHACIGCQECLLACPTITAPLSINELNAQTYGGDISLDVARLARACTLCGACVSVCPVGLRRDTMMLWLKVRLSKTTLRKNARTATGLHQWMSPLNNFSSSSIHPPIATSGRERLTLFQKLRVLFSRLLPPKNTTELLRPHTQFIHISELGRRFDKLPMR